MYWENRLGESAQRARDDPKPRVVPERKKACDGITHDALGNDDVRIGEYSPVSRDLLLTGKTAGRRVVFSCHGSSRFFFCDGGSRTAPVAAESDTRIWQRIENQCKAAN